MSLAAACVKCIRGFIREPDLIAAMKFISESELKVGNHEFFVGHCLFHKLEKRDGKSVVIFGKVPKGFTILTTTIILITLVTGLLLAKNTDNPPVTILFTIAIALALFFTHIVVEQFHKDFIGKFIELAPRRCVLRHHRQEAVIENVQSVTVLNSFGDTEHGKSELFIGFLLDGKVCYVPILYIGSQGSGNRLAKTMAQEMAVEFIDVNGDKTAKS